MKKLTYISSFALLAALTACDSSDMPVQHPESYDYITFSAQTQKLITRANPYEAYDNTRHPDNMGVFGFYNASLNNTVFNNDIVNYDAASRTWTQDDKKRWTDFKTARSFDFLACMPQTEGTAVTASTDGTVYTLSMPYTMTATTTSSDGVSTSVAAPVIFSTKQAPIVCALPCHKDVATADGTQEAFDHVVALQFDQTLTGYRLLFKLGDNMGAIRKFRIKSVSLSGDLATGGTVSRSYTLANGTWTAGDIKWTDLTRQSATASPLAISYVDSDIEGADNTGKTLLVGSKDFSQWGDAFYTIPDTKFMPTISVTYDVELTAEDGTQVVTRKDIKSTIILNKDNFSNRATETTANIYPVTILIQPRYLYVLADDDAYAGHLLID